MKTVLRNSYSPKIGDYCETIVVDKETENAYIFDCDGVFTPMPQPVDVEKILEEAAEYTDETVAPLKEKLDTIEEGAQVNTIEHILKNGVEQTITNKTVNVTVPTKTSDLTNDGSDGTDTYVESAALSDYYTKDETDTQIGYETTAREIADEGLQTQIDAIVASSDVVDIVGTYADLQAYDTSKLHDNDIIKVLADETHDDATTYYRWSTSTEAFTYIGGEGPYYTKAESDATFVPQTRTVNNKALSSNITLTASDVGALPDSTVIPTVNDASLKIQKNGTDIVTFTANSATNEVANITVPTDTNDLTNGAGYITAASLPTKTSDLTNDGSDGTSTYAETDELPTKTSDLTNDGSDGTSTYVEADDLATVATTGDYSDLLNTPTIPTVNNATLTIQKNGTNIDTFTANASVDKTINVTVPTDTSDLTNTAGFITSSALSNYYTKSETYDQQEVNALINAITIPTKTSELTNDGADGTSTYVEAADLATVATTGDYDDLLNKPTIPTIVDMTGATASTAGAHGYVPAPAAGDEDKVLKGDGTWGTVAAPYSAGTGIDITNNVISADTTVLATQTDLSSKQDALTAGNAIDITNNTVSVEVDSVLDVSSTNPVQNSVITAALPTDMTGASSTVAGAHGLVPAPAAGDNTKYLAGDGTWKDVSVYQLPIASDTTLGGIKVGSNLSIDSQTGVLSATDTTYSAGTGLDLTGTTFSVDTTTIAEKSDLPTKTSDLTNDGSDGTSTYVEADDLATVATSGSYTDLSNTPTIPTVNNATLTIQKNSTTVDTFTANASVDKTINITVPVTAADVSALPASTKYGASLTMSIDSSTYVVTTTLKDQDGNTLGTAQTIDLPLESVVVNGSYDSTNKKIVLTLQNGNTIDIPVGDLVSGLQTEITSNNMLDADLVDDSTSTHKFTTASDISKLAGIESGAEVNVQADWNQTTNTADDYIKNKPNLATVATSGSYTDLSDKPTIPAAQVNSDWDASSGVSQILNKPNLATVATSGSYNDLSNKPHIPDDMVVLSYGTSTYADALAAYQSNSVVYCRASSNSNPATGSQNRMAFLAYVNDSTTPTEFEFQYYRSVATHSDTTQGDEVFIYKLNQSTGWSVTKRNAYSKIVAGTNMSSSYSSGTLTLSATQPTVNDATLTITQNGTSAGTFTANASSNATIALTDTTYSDFVGTDGQTAGTAGLVPAPTTGDGDSYLKGDGTWGIPPGSSYVAGDHIDITGNVITAEGYVHSDSPVSATTPGSVVSGADITDGSITFDKTSTGEFLKLTLSTTDIGEGAALAANTLYGVYE